MNLDAFQQLPLRGGFLLLRVTMTSEPMVDAMGRLALAKTSIVGFTTGDRAGLFRARSQ
jgi:hypothetical protein